MGVEYITVALAGATAILAILDSRLLDPYFAFYELVPGMGFGDAAIRGNRRARAAVIRRFGYGFVLGLVIAAMGAVEVREAIAAGVVVTLLLLWPMLIHGIPRGKLQSDWLLLLLYVAVLLIYVAAAVAGQAFYMLAAEGDLVAWVRDQALELAFITVALAIAFGILDRGGQAKEM